MGLVKRIFIYIKPLWFRSFVALVCMAGVASLSTGIVWIGKYIIDIALTAKDLESLKTGVFLLILSIGLKSILWYTHTYLTSYVSQTAIQNIRNDTYSHLYSLSMGFLMNDHQGEFCRDLQTISLYYNIPFSPHLRQLSVMD